MEDDFKLDFAGVGAGKAGTTWIAACLREHPQVCIAKGKETNYFCTQHSLRKLPLTVTRYTSSQRWRGEKWFQSLFSHHQPGQLRGEFSPTYISDPTTPALLHEHNPNMKLIFNYRNPVDVLYSGYYQITELQPIHESFEEFFDLHPEFIDYSSFYTNTMRYLEHFPREQMFFILMDDIKADSEKVYRDLCRFLEIDPEFTPESLHKRVNERVVVRYRWLRDIVSKIIYLLSFSKPVRKLVKEPLKRLGAGKLAYQIRVRNNAPDAYVPMSPETRARLVEIFREENEKLGEFLGRDLSHWNQ